MCDFCGSDEGVVEVEVYSPATRSVVTLEACYLCEADEVWLAD